MLFSQFKPDISSDLSSDLDLDLDLDLDSKDIVNPLNNYRGIDKTLNEEMLLLSKNRGFTETMSKLTRIRNILDITGNVSIKQGYLSFVKELIKERKKHEKGTYENAFYKLLANAGIGQYGRGLNLKRGFDTRTGSTQFIPSGRLSKPLIGGWITGFIRTVISELLNQLDKEGAMILSCTTDGFITNKSGLETFPYTEEIFTKIFMNAREKLDTPRQVLEFKFFDKKGIFSWTTRGQLGQDSKIRAMTGFSPGGKDLTELRDLVTAGFSDFNRNIPFIQRSLDSGTDIFKKGGPVSMAYKEKDFNLVYDNRRVLSTNEEEIKNFDFSKNSLYSKPHNNIDDCKTFRSLSRLSGNKFLKESIFLKSHEDNTYLSLAVRMFLRAYKQSPKLYGLEINTINKDTTDKLSRVDIQKLIQEASQGKIIVTANYISLQNTRKILHKQVPRVKITSSFFNKMKESFPLLDIDRFLQ